MRVEVILAIISKEIEARLANLPQPSRGPRGAPGRDGVDGKDFCFEDHVDTLKAWIKEASLKFSDLTDDEIAQLRGSPGKDGRDGRPGEDGKSFSMEEHGPQIRQWVEQLIPKFKDFTPEQIAAIRGEKGADGKSFVFDDHALEIEKIIFDAVEAVRPDLKLKFEDLTEDERASLRGPRGERGRPGKDFDLTEHLEFFQTLKLKFSDLTPQEVDSLKLTFSHLSDDEKNQLKLKFSDLTEEEKFSLRGPRGQRGKQGVAGLRGERGEKGEKGDTVIGPRGPVGPIGPQGRNGIDGINGRDGRNGADAPVVVDIELNRTGREISFTFHFSDGSSIETPSVKLPASDVYVIGGGGGGSSGDGSGNGAPGEDGKSAYELWLDEGNSGSISDFLDSLIGAPGTNGTDGVDGESAYEIWLAEGNTGTEQDFLDSLKGPQGDPGPGGGDVLSNVACDPSVFVGAAVRFDTGTPEPIPMGDWPSMVLVEDLTVAEYPMLVVNALADSYENSNVIGIVEGKPTSTTCNVRILGRTGSIFFGLDMAKEYYLSDVTPGGIVRETSAPSDPGSVRVRIGQPLSSSELLFSRGERRIIS